MYTSLQRQEQWKTPHFQLSSFLLHFITPCINSNVIKVQFKTLIEVDNWSTLLVLIVSRVTEGGGVNKPNWHSCILNCNIVRKLMVQLYPSTFSIIRSSIHVCSNIVADYGCLICKTNYLVKVCVKTSVCNSHSKWGWTVLKITNEKVKATKVCTFPHTVPSESVHTPWIFPHFMKSWIVLSQ
jgi:hypothetical protein